MSAATDISTDLSWVTFSSDDGERCDIRHADCAAEAAAVAFWQVLCSCAPERQPLCVQHRDLIAGHAAKPWPHQPRFHCAHCRSLIVLLRIEPLR